MKRSIKILLLFLVLATAFSSCSTKVDLYAGYKDIPVVYGLIDVTQDTNYVKIIRAFSGSDDASINAEEVAMIPDSNNYPGKLDVRFYEYRCRETGSSYSPTGRVIVLDTITIHSKVPGSFYYPDQKVYYTTERFNADEQEGHSRYKYKYRLEIVKGNDTISSETSLVGGDGFRITTINVDFVPTSEAQSKITFFSAANAYLYEISMEFNYKEKHPHQDTICKKVEWSLGTYHYNELHCTEYSTSKQYDLPYNHATLFNLLSSRIGGDTLNVTRIIGDFNIKIAAGGNELYNYIQVNEPSSSFAQNVSDYTNIAGGYGVLSSRINISKKVNLSANTITTLIDKSGWGFKQDLGK
ncbi:MAG: hypothetical protein MJZ91_02490 [Bacteroidales bacterium]|nr:hypothetical protein [Bacteroidales bacterium]